MQACTSCGAQLTAEEMICPYCNTPKASYVPAQKLRFEKLDLLGGEKASFELNASPTLQKQGARSSHTFKITPLPLISPPAPEGPRIKASRKSVLIIAIIIIFVVALGVLGYRTYYTNVYYPNQLHSQATATVDSVTATAYVAANVVATVNARADDPQSIYTNTTNGDPTFTDSLASEGTSDWISDSGDPGSACTFESGALYVTTNSTSTFFPCYGQHIFSNFIFKVRMTIINGDGGVILFRAASENQDKYYALFIRPTGQFTLDMYKSSSSSDATVLGRAYLRWFNSGLNQMNSIAILARDNTFSLFVNEKYVTDIIDANQTYSQGLFALGAMENKFKTTVAFNYVQIWSL